LDAAIAGANRLGLNLAANFLAFLLNAGMGFFLAPFIVARLGVAAYGLAQLALMMTNFAAIFTIGLTTMAARFISIEINKSNLKKANIYFNSALGANAAMAGFLLILSIPVIIFISNFFHIPADLLADTRWAFAFAFVNILIALLGNVFSVATFAQNKIYLSSLRNMEGNILRVVCLIALFVAFGARISFITLSATAFTIYIIFTDIYYTKKLLPKIKLQRAAFSLKAVKTLLKSGVWNSLEQLNSVIQSSLDLWLAGVLFGAAIMGNFAIAKTIPIFFIMMISSITAVFAPQFTMLFAQKKQAELLAAVRLAMKIMAIITALPAAFLLVFGDIFFALWQPGIDSALLSRLNALILVPILISCATQPLFKIFTVTNKLKIPAIVFFITGAANIALMLILHRFTPMGIFSIPAAAIIIRGLRTFTFNPIYAAHALEIPRFSLHPTIFKGLACVIIMLFTSYGFRLIFAVESWFMLIIAAIASGVLALLICVFLMFNRAEMQEIWGFVRSGQK